MNFPGIGLAHSLIFHKNLIGPYEIFVDEFFGNQSSMTCTLKFGEKMDLFSKNRSVSRPGKLKFRKIFGISFPGFAHKGKLKNFKIGQYP